MSNPATNQLIESQDDTSRKLSRIWQEVLGVEIIGLDQNYFDLGGDSSLAVHLFAQIEQVFKVKLPLATLFDAPTVGELAEILRREVSTSGPVATCGDSDLWISPSTIPRALGWREYSNLP